MNYNKVIQAHKRIKPYIHKTPLFHQQFIDERAGLQVYLKLENFQKTGSFKARGALNKVLSLSGEQRNRGIVAASSGNHGGAVAYAGKLFHIPTTVVVPQDVMEAKKRAIEGYGAQVILCGTTSQERLERAWEISKEEGKTFIHPYDDEDIMAGQGTMACEIVEDMPQIEAILVPVGGGGMISGISQVKEKYPHIKIIGVEPLYSAKMKLSIERGAITRFPHTQTIADGLRAIQPGDKTFPIAKERVDEFVTVEDKEMVETMKDLLERGKILIEPSGAVTAAYAMGGNLKGRFHKVACVISGGNIGLDKLLRIYEGYSL